MIIVPVNEVIRVKNECNDPEINVMALKMKENYQKNYFSRSNTAKVGRAVTLTIAPISQKNNQEKLPKNSEDIESINVCICTDGGNLAAQQLHTLFTCRYLYMYISEKSLISDSEAKTLNETNIKHCDGIYEKYKFYAGKGCMVRIEDLHEFYTFIETSSVLLYKQ
ncbi:Uncharacterized protein FWK35_00020620 [Aphis craccivora]|uniref:Uncharacterized protein n=1 Tax=Aphis craccivora TaxID=307492 RepID=A0A6G0Y8K3_APHCR|nr:Uncharacterized protein FWK35_00020620 [Aphis craccivora]